MINLKTTKLIASALAITSVLALGSFKADAAWRQDSTGWWYSEGSSWATGWKQIGPDWYYFNSNGYMVHDCYVDNYYLGSNGAMVSVSNKTNTNTVNSSLPINIPSNWTKVNDTTYYINSTSPLVYSYKGTFGQPENNIILGIKSTIITKTGYNEEIKTFNGNQAYCYEYLDLTSRGIEKFYMVYIFKNNKVHGFVMCGDIDNYYANKASLESALNTSLRL